MERLKLIIYAILISFFWDNLVILLQFLNGKEPLFDFIISILVLTVVANVLIYKIFVVKNKKAYILICIPCAYFELFLCFNIWERMFIDITRYGLGAVLLWIYSMITSICVFGVVLFVRKLITKRNAPKPI